MIDEVDVRDWFAQHEAAMGSFTWLANRYGQDLEARVIPSGPLVGSVLVRRDHDRPATAIISPDGRVVDLEELREKQRFTP